MPITAERLEVDVQADTSDARRDLDQFQRSTATAGSSASAAGGKASSAGKKFSMFGGLVKAAAGSMIAAVGTGAVMAASDLNEQVSKTGVVFGPQAKVVTDAAQQMADKFGMSKTVFLEAASGIGLVGKASGLTQKGAAGLSTDMARLAADASSFYNVPVTEALDAMKSGLVGEAEPMRRFGVLLSDAAVQAESARLGLSTMGDELTEGQKVQARSSLIMKGMTDAQGDLARTSDSVANRVKELQGRATNFAADMGSKALPAVAAFLGAVIKAPQVIGGMVNAVRDYISTNATFRPILDAAKVGVMILLEAIRQAPAVFNQVKAAITGFIQENQWVKAVLDQVALAVVAFTAAFLAVMAVQKVIAVLKAVRVAVIAMNAAMMANPVALIIASLVALGLVLYAAYQRFESVRTVVDAVGAALRTGFVATLDFVKAKWAEWGPAILSTLTSVGQAIMGFVQAVLPALKAGFQVMLAVAKNVWNTIKGVVQGAVKVIQGIVNVVMGVIKGDWGRAWQGIKQILSGVWQIIVSLVKGAVNNLRIMIGAALGVIKGLWSAGWNALKGLVSRAWDGIVNAVKSGVSNVVGWVKGLPGKITGALSGLGSLLTNAGTQVIEGFWTGLKSKWEDVKAWFGSVTDAIPDLKGPRAKDRKLLVENGEAVMAGFKEGLNREWSEVQALLRQATKWVGSKAMDAETSAALEKRLERIGKRVKGLLAKNADLAARYATAVQDHADKVQAKADFRQSTFQGMNAQANVMNAGSTGSAIAASLKAQVEKVQAFGLRLANLAARGLNRDAIAQISAAGVDGGAAVAEALTNATDTELGSINASFASIASAATSTADYMASNLHDAGINVAQGVVDGLASKQAAIQSTLQAIAKGMVGAIKEVVKQATREAAAEAKAAADAEKSKAAKGTATVTAQDAPGGAGKGPRGGEGPGKPGKPSDRVSGGNDRQARAVNFSVTAHNPVAEPASRTVNKGLARAASLGLV